MNKYWAFAIYSILFEAIIWGIFGYAVFILNASGWWFVLAFTISIMQLKPSAFGIK